MAQWLLLCKPMDPLKNSFIWILIAVFLGPFSEALAAVDSKEFKKPTPTPIPVHFPTAGSPMRRTLADGVTPRKRQAPMRQHQAISREYKRRAVAGDVDGPELTLFCAINVVSLWRTTGRPTNPSGSHWKRRPMGVLELIVLLVRMGPKSDKIQHGGPNAVPCLG